MKKKLFSEYKLISLFERFIPTRIIETMCMENYLPENSQNVVFGKISQNSKGDLFFSHPQAIAPMK